MTRALFTKPLDSIEAADISALTGWPESETVEYKSDLPAREERKDAWHSGGHVEQHAKDRLFKEVVALANTSGGHLILGVDETDDKPAAAARITPVPQCADLAERLERAAQAIEPSIPRLLVRGVVTEDDGSSGVVVFRVPASPRAPHRGTDKDCYIRRGASSVRMSMREIQDMTIAGLHREEAFEARIAKRRSEFSEWFQQLPNTVVGFRITCMPAGSPFGLDRLYGKLPPFDLRQDYKVLVGGGQFSACPIRFPVEERPILRGVRRERIEPNISTFMDIHSDGSVNSGCCRAVEDDHTRALYIGWIVGYGITMLQIADKLRTVAEMPDSECAIESELVWSHANQPPQLKGWQNERSFSYDVGEPPKQPPLMLPRVSFGPASDLDRVLSTICTDICDALGARYVNPTCLKVLL